MAFLIFPPASAETGFVSANLRVAKFRHPFSPFLEDPECQLFQSGQRMIKKLPPPLAQSA